LAKKKEELRRQYEENKKNVNQIDSDAESDGEDFISAEQLEEFKILDTELTNKELSEIRQVDN